MPQPPSSTVHPAATPLIIIGLVAMGVGLFAVDYGIGLLEPKSYMDEDALLQGGIIGGLGAVALGAGLALRIHLAIMPLPLIAFAVPVAFGYQASKQLVTETEQGYADTGALFDSMQSVCETSTGNPSAAAYPGDAGFRPTLAYTQSSDGDWYGHHNSLPDEWRPESADEVELVVCVQNETRSTGSCEYSTSTGPRFVSQLRYVRVVMVREARTGRLLLHDRIEGEPPASTCPATFDFTSGRSSIEGRLPSDEEVYALASRYVRLRGLTPPQPSIRQD